ncbi:type IV secretory system conjugative DNA transfer VirD4/TraG family protein [Amycolatopsis echigonensis]|uniref:Type IV secretory system conjugative DNA transfer VirD4/TraG family protein n=1 Tax=Amycolatopsis echigonensis TaxID=2576905 RepID=A0A2N3X0E1_9PSEU|nr:type IV secretory system conjugative DNA transfer family protein [Amycolatopsis niigatensis]PKV99583.1 type IV secretory system conjugative DNA transfer VirD4/TraG family protein [Amycolatopsis niigatensis]
MRTFFAAVVAGVLIFLGAAMADWHMKVAVVWPWFVVAGAVVALFRLVELTRGNVARLMVGLAGLAVVTVWFAIEAPDATPGYDVWPWGLAGVPVLVVAGVMAVQARGGSRGLIGRWSRRSRRNGGTASRWQIFRVASKFAMKRKAKVLKPSLRRAMWWSRWRVPVTEYATAVVRVGRQRIWSPVEDVTLRFGGPRSGKTGELTCRILDAPGAVIATSTRTDLIDLTEKLRSQRGPTYVFNPSGLGKLESTITFDPLAGCDNPVTATHRGSDLLPDSGAGEEREHWVSQARRALAALLHAAALGELTMRDVLSWVSDPEEAADEVLRLLRRSPEPAFEKAAQQFLTTNDRTRSSITTTIMPALGWLTDPNASAAAAPGGSFDVEQLLADRGTVYMLGADEGHTAPLVAALTSHIAREARRVASESPGGRLDPALTLVLDEAALVSPVPLPKWTADMGGRNITIHIGAQSRAQLIERWGATGCATIMTNSATLLVLSNQKDPDDLQAYSLLTADRHEKVENEDADGHVTGRTPQRVPVLTPGQISQLPKLHAVVIRQGMPAAIGKLQMAWKRADVKAVERQERWSEFAERHAARIERWQDRRDEFAIRVGAFVDALADRVEPWLERVDAWFDARAEARRQARRAARVRVSEQDHAEPMVRADALRVDAAPAEPGEGE